MGREDAAAIGARHSPTAPAASSGDGLFGPLARLAPRATWARLVVLGVDVVLFNWLFYEAMRSLLLEPLGFTSALGTTAWLAAFGAALVILHGLKPRQRPASLAAFVVELVLFSALFVVAAYAASLRTTGKGADFSWLRIEMVKTPLWFGMYVKTCPGFTALFIAVAALLAWRSVAAPRSWWVRLLPGLPVAARAWPASNVATTASSSADTTGAPRFTSGSTRRRTKSTLKRKRSSWSRVMAVSASALG